MQQTQKYKLNLIEPSDPFLPEGLNENTRKLEAVVSQHLEDMEARVTVLEAHHFACGYYWGTDVTGSDHTEQHFNLGFKPKSILLCMMGNNPRCYTEGCEDQYLELRITEDGFYVYNQSNLKGHYYCYYAFK